MQQGQYRNRNAKRNDNKTTSVRDNTMIDLTLSIWIATLLTSADLLFSNVTTPTTSHI